MEWSCTPIVLPEKFFESDEKTFEIEEVETRLEVSDYFHVYACDMDFDVLREPETTGR